MTSNNIKQRTETLIIGSGFAGLYLSNVFSDNGYNDFLVIAPDTKTVSDKSYFQFRSRGMRQDSLKKTIHDAGQGKSNRQLVSLFINNIDDEITRLSSLAVLQPSYVGVKVKEPSKLLKNLAEKIKNKKIIGEVTFIKKQRGNVVVKTTNGLILCQKIVFCTGGLRSNISPFFQDEKVESNIFNIAKSLKCKTAYLDKIMYHPFYSGKNCIPTDDLFGFEIVGADGKKLPITNKLIESHNAHFRFKEILNEMKKAGDCLAVKESMKIKLNIAPHYRLGGIVINKRGQTNIKNVYALGECSYGLHGLGRAGGCALSEIIVMARVIGKELTGKAA